MFQSPCWDQRSQHGTQCAAVSIQPLQILARCDWHVLVSAADILWLLRCAVSRSAGTLKSDAIVAHFTRKTDYLAGDWAFLIIQSACLFQMYSVTFHCNQIWGHWLLWPTWNRIRPLMDCCNKCNPGSRLTAGDNCLSALSMTQQRFKAGLMCWS